MTTPPCDNGLDFKTTLHNVKMSPVKERKLPEMYWENVKKRRRDK